MTEIGAACAAYMQSLHNQGFEPEAGTPLLDMSAFGIAMGAALEAAAAVRWQPIETAPERALVWADGWDHPVVGERVNREWFLISHEGNLTYLLCEDMVRLEPTHWSPIPPPPSTTEGDDDA